MQRHGDRPAGNEIYLNDHWSLTPGRAFAYLYGKESDQIYLLQPIGQPQLTLVGRLQTTPVRRFDEPSPSVVDRFARPPQGIILHGTRSGRSHSRQREFEGTRRFASSGANGLAWHATGGDDAYAVHLLPTHWGWHARSHSRNYLGYEFAQPTVNDVISDGQLRAFVAWLRDVVLPVWPNFDPLAPGALIGHSETEWGQADGKSDPFPLGDRRLAELKERLRQALSTTL
jgi:hypothetical protein